MGCISSKKPLDDLHPNIFQVMNVDELGSPLSPGQLELRELDLILYQADKSPLKWPLRSLRRYGYDMEVFSFEAGRRCVTGPGIYAFQCRRADQLFNMLQSKIQLCCNADNESLTVFSTQTSDSNYLEPAPMRRATQNGRCTGSGMTRLSSVGSASGSVGPLSPQSTTSPSLPLEMAPAVPSLPTPARPPSQNFYAKEETPPTPNTVQDEANNNKTATPLVLTPTSPTQPPIPLVDAQEPVEETKEPESSYEKLEEMSSTVTALTTTPPPAPAEQIPSHLYMNLIPSKDIVKPPPTPAPLVASTVAATSTTPPATVPIPSLTSIICIEIDKDEEPKHCYANLDPGEVDGISRSRYAKAHPPPLKSINYIVLDLEPNAGDAPKSPTTSLPPESPRKPKPLGGYATIDFNKTVALANPINPDIDSGCSRRTRHNSTINEFVPKKRNSSSLSE